MKARRRLKELDTGLKTIRTLCPKRMRLGIDTGVKIIRTQNPKRTRLGIDTGRRVIPERPNRRASERQLKLV